MTVPVETTVEGARAAIALLRGQGRSVALVPTLGALHEGHLALVERGRRLADAVVVSIFVNPLQFGAGEDLDRYPRTLEADLALLEGRADLVFAPTTAAMYPRGPVGTRVVAGPVGQRFEGRSRPGHFDGVLTVVAKLLSITGPDVAVFGAKDAQQLFLVTRMVEDLDLPVRIEPVPIVREADGLARSSRNRYLDGAERAEARALSRALQAAESAAERGPDAAVAAAQGVLAGEPRVALDYLAVVDPASFGPVDDGYRGPALVLVAARVGDTRLIDNALVVLG